MTNTILLAALQERYNSIHIIRERVQNMSLRIMGILFWSSGWIIQSNICLSLCEIIFAVIATGVLRFILKEYFKDLKKWFENQRDVAARLEIKLGFYSGSTSLYPVDRKTPKSGKFFEKNWRLVNYGFIIFIISLLTLLLKYL
jgi:hypothetical protein